MKKRKISAKIAAIVGSVEIAAMVFLSITVNYRLSDILEARAIDYMSVTARDRARLVENYIDGCCEFLNRYTRVPVVRAILADRNDGENLAHVNELTRSYSSSHDHLEGLYVAEWDTFVISHTNPASVGRTFRDPEAAKELERRIRSEKKAFCMGIVRAPVSKAMVIPIYSPVYNDARTEMVGFTGAAFYTDALGEMLESQSDGKIRYSIVNAATEDFIFHEDGSVVGTKCADEAMLTAMRRLRSGGNGSRTLSYKTESAVVTCYYMAERGWVFTLEDSVGNVFGTVSSVRHIFTATCVVVTAVMILVCGIGVGRQIKPIRIINDRIERLKANDFSLDDSLDAYRTRNDEIGAIANAVEELRSSQENQHLIFLEILEAQTVGTLITDADDNRIVLINNVAVKFYGLDPAKKGELTLADIQAHFSPEEMRKIADSRGLAHSSRDEVKFETFVNHDDGSVVHLQTHVKAVRLSNGERVVIYSSVDITSRKQLEANLLVLSETDSLTQISNRRSGERRVSGLMAEGRGGMFCLFDANKFKFVNDNFGHTAGDRVLVEIAACMKKSFRGDDVLVRLGGDEFVVFAAGIEDREMGRRVLDRFMQKISEIDIPGLNGHRISVSLGAVITEGKEEFSRLYTKADSLMYDCKKQGGNAYKFYGSE